MKVRELIQKLQSFNQELPVMVNGYESGITENFGIKEVSVNRNVNHVWYYGEHKEDMSPTTPHDLAILFDRNEDY